MNKIILLIVPALLLNGFVFAHNTSSDESAAITKTALDYVEGWYAGDAARMERALHPELAKRMISTDPKTGHSQFNQWARWRSSNARATAAGKKRRQIGK